MRTLIRNLQHKVARLNAGLGRAKSPEARLTIARELQSVREYLRIVENYA